MSAACPACGHVVSSKDRVPYRPTPAGLAALARDPIHDIPADPPGVYPRAYPRAPRRPKTGA